MENAPLFPSRQGRAVLWAVAALIVLVNVWVDYYHRGWAVELMFEAAQHHGVLPDDLELLYRIARPSCSRKKFEVEIGVVLSDYRRAVIDGQPKLVHPGLLRWCGERLQTSAKRAEAGRRGGLARGSRDRETV